MSARRAARQAALEQLQHERKHGSRLSALNLDEDDVFMEVGQDEYRDIVRRRQKAIVPGDEEDGDDYMDPGHDDIYADSDSDSDMDGGRKKKQKPTKRKKKGGELAPERSRITAAFSRASTLQKQQRSRKPKAAEPVSQAEAPGADDFLSNLLDEVDDDGDVDFGKDDFEDDEDDELPEPTRNNKPNKRTIAAASSSASSSSSPAKPALESSPRKRVRASPEPAIPTVTPTKEAGFEAGALPPTAPKPKVADSGTDWFQVQNEQSTAAAAAAAAVAAVETSTSMEDVEDEMPSLPNDSNDLLMYWLDAYELPFGRGRGVLYLFGRAHVPGQKETVSCCVQVQALERDLYVLPRTHKVADPNDDSSVTDEPVHAVDVHKELQELLSSRFGIKKLKMRPVTKRYVFQTADEVDPEEENHGDDPDALPTTGARGSYVPRECTYYNVRYSATQPPLPRGLKGRTFSRVFGTRSSALEVFVLHRKLMGPGWLRISGAERATSQLSWCAAEFRVASPRQVSVMSDEDAAKLGTPTLRVLSLSLKTYVHPKSQQHEIVAVSGLLHKHVHVDGPTLEWTRELTSFTIARPPQGKAHPPGANQMAQQLEKQRGGRSKLTLCGNERGLLNLLIAKIHTLDPDVILGHDLHGFMVEVLTRRMRRCNVQFWSKLGRLKRSQLPKSSAGFSLVDAGVAAGRLFCDTQTSAKELIRQDSYELSALAGQQLRVTREALDADRVPSHFDTVASLQFLVQHTENDAFLGFGLMFKLEVLPLTRQLTVLCGNIWQRSLRSARAERIEYLLLHQFYERDFIVPEKFSSRERKLIEAQKAKAAEAKAKDELAAAGGGAHDDDDVTDKSGAAASGRQVGGKSQRKRQKAEYKGGLVLEPKSGFYDKYVVLLDFNSLYPSIIREFNICHTTVEHWKAGQPKSVAVASASAVSANSTADAGSSGAGTTEEMAGLPAVPPFEMEEGILPTVVKRLLDRRRQVKKLLKRETDPIKAKQLDIRQKALKLVANSMYGCLGFSGSRFVCKPLAALVTAQGRSILQRTAEQTEALGFNVIYGDTDSIMVSCETTDLEEVRRIGHTVQREVNKRYRVLEIAIDGIFKTMLLLTKKRYAALMLKENKSKKPDAPAFTAVREVKGIDLVRRDWCALSKDVGHFVLDRILSGDDREEVMEAIRARLRKAAEDVRANKIPLEKYVITKGLTKAPRDYGDANSQPHVRVALQMVEQLKKPVRVGDYIPYVICLGDANSYAERSFHPELLLQAGGALTIDFEWYLANQILPPVARLLAPLPEASASMLANCLGLDASKFDSSAFGMPGAEADADEDEDAGHSFLKASKAQDEERFEHCTKLHLTCPSCRLGFDMPGVFDHDHDGRSGLTCNNRDCKTDALANPAGLCNVVALHLRDAIRRNANHVAKCSEPGCGRVTRQRSSIGARCLEVGCHGELQEQYPARLLYEQIYYFRTLFDVERATMQLNHFNKQLAENHKPKLKFGKDDLPAQHRRAYDQVLHFIQDRYLKRNHFYGPIHMREVYANQHTA